MFKWIYCHNKAFVIWIQSATNRSASEVLINTEWFPEQLSSVSPVAPGFVELPPEDADEDGDEDEAEEAEYDDDRTGVAPSDCSITSSRG